MTGSAAGVAAGSKSPSPRSWSPGQRLVRGAFPVGVAVLACVVFGAGLGGLPLWRDEAASLAVASRPVAGILASAARIDVVHTAYYLLLHPLLAFGDGEAWVRLPSLLGAVATVVITAELARRLLGAGPAAVTAALLVGNPWFAFYAREARPYALAAALVAAAAFALLGGPPTRGRRFAFTGLGVLATAMHLFALLPVLGLLVASAPVRWRRAGAESPGRAGCAVVLVAAAAPLALLAAAQSGQVSWIGRPGLADVTTLLGDATGSWGGALVVPGALAAALLTTALRTAPRTAPRTARRRPRGAAPVRRDLTFPARRRAVAFPRSGGVLPPGGVLRAALVGTCAGPLVLLGASWVGVPRYVERYALPGLPLLALATGAAVALVGRVVVAGAGQADAPGAVDSGAVDSGAVGSGAVDGGGRAEGARPWRASRPRRAGLLATAVAVVLPLVGVPAAAAGPSDKTEDLRAAAVALAAAAQPGDCVAYDPSWARIGLTHYLDVVDAPALRDAALDPGPAGQEPVGLFPAERSETDVEGRLRGCARVWVAGYPGPVGRWRPVPEVTGAALAAVADDFTVGDAEDFGDFRLVLWTARPVKIARLGT